MYLTVLIFRSVASLFFPRKHKEILVFISIEKIGFCCITTNNMFNYLGCFENCYAYALGCFENCYATVLNFAICFENGNVCSRIELRYREDLLFPKRLIE
ncbi:hypothetical protein VPH35_072908 [Triticum aestivum]